jgi:hypothetical protein
VCAIFVNAFWHELGNLALDTAAWADSVLWPFPEWNATVSAEATVPGQKALTSISLLVLSWLGLRGTM